MAKIKITFEFDLFEERVEFEILSANRKMFMAICEVERSMRDSFKHNDKIGDCDEAYRLIEEWRDMLRESGVVDL
jgi:hypothetical protein